MDQKRPKETNEWMNEFTNANIEEVYTNKKKPLRREMKVKHKNIKQQKQNCIYLLRCIKNWNI